MSRETVQERGEEEEEEEDWESPATKALMQKWKGLNAKG